ncbi:unnamed protein product [Lathyrus sativus]|nr:unnamed protein product [Lathyrus sativus]
MGFRFSPQQRLLQHINFNFQLLQQRLRHFRF